MFFGFEDYFRCSKNLVILYNERYDDCCAHVHCLESQSVLDHSTPLITSQSTSYPPPNPRPSQHLSPP